MRSAIAFAAISALSLALWATPAFAAPGDLDPTFSLDGEMTTFGEGGSAAIAIQPDGKVIITGSDRFGFAPRGFVLERVRSNGNLDRSFGYEGRVETGFDGGGAATAVALQADGRIVAAGESGGGNFALARYMPDGTLDESFSGEGTVSTDISGHITDVLLGPDGRIAVAGDSYPEGSVGADFEVARFNADGSLDDSFSGNGVQTLDLGSDDFLMGVALAPDGDLVLAGTSSNKIAIVRLTPDGTPDASFSDDGILTAQYSEDTDRARDVAVQPDGKIVTAGYGYGRVPHTCCGRFQFELVRLMPDGELDPTFSGGVVRTRIQGEAIAWGLALQPDGKLVAAGESYDDFALARYNPDGTLDDSFSDDGRLTTSFEKPPYYLPGPAVADDVAIAPDGRIVVGGYVKWEEEWILTRYEDAPGPPDADADGVQDSQDLCPASFGHDGGCPHFRRSLSVRFASRYDEFRGKLVGVGYECRARQTVAVYRRRPGLDRRIGRDSTDYHGNWEVSRFQPRGRYYARVKRRVHPSFGVCARARSDVLAFQG